MRLTAYTGAINSVSPISGLPPFSIDQGPGGLLGGDFNEEARAGLTVEAFNWNSLCGRIFHVFEGQVLTHPLPQRKHSDQLDNPKSQRLA